MAIVMGSNLKILGYLWTRIRLFNILLLSFGQNFESEIQNNKDNSCFHFVFPLSFFLLIDLDDSWMILIT